MSDNPGGGGTSDSVVILQEMLDRGVTNAVVATIVDPAVVEQAHAAGVGAQISGMLGDARTACRLPAMASLRCSHRCAAVLHRGQDGRTARALAGIRKLPRYRWHLGCIIVSPRLPAISELL